VCSNAIVLLQQIMTHFQLKSVLKMLFSWIALGLPVGPGYKHVTESVRIAATLRFVS
jgi:hypothetical protein